jgi:hypothetical protein
MFEIKYDREGAPIREKSRIEEYAKQAESEVPPTPTQHFPEVPEAESVVQAQESDEIEDTVSQGDPTETTSEPVPVVASAPVEEESDAKKSFRELKEAKRKAERERDEYLRRIEEFESGSRHKQTATTPKEQSDEDEAFHLGDDDIAEGKHISKVDKRAQSKIKALEERLSKYEAQSAEEKAETALRAKYADFDKVVSRDNIEMLTEAYPELARSLYSTNDLYTKAVSAYTLIKKFGIYQESPFNSEKAIAMKNVAKPRPLASVSPQQGETPMTRANAFANGLTDDLKAQLRREMEEARKGH